MNVIRSFGHAEYRCTRYAGIDFNSAGSRDRNVSYIVNAVVLIFITANGKS